MDKLVNLPWSDPTYGAYQLPEAQANALLAANAAFREKYGRDIKLVSAFRDEARNRAAGGAPNSNHVHGNAIDIDRADIKKAAPFLQAQGWQPLGGTYYNPKTGKTQSEDNHFNWTGASSGKASSPSQRSATGSAIPPFPGLSPADIAGLLDPEKALPELRSALNTKVGYTGPALPKTGKTQWVSVPDLVVNTQLDPAILRMATTKPAGPAQATNFFGDLGNSFLNQASFNTLNKPTGGGVGSFLGTAAGGLANVGTVAAGLALTPVAPELTVPLALGLGGGLGQASQEARAQINQYGSVKNPLAVAGQFGIGGATNLIPAAKGGSLVTRLAKDAAVGAAGGAASDIVSQVARGGPISAQELLQATALGAGGNAMGQFLGPQAKRPDFPIDPRTLQQVPGVKASQAVDPAMMQAARKSITEAQRVVVNGDNQTTPAMARIKQLDAQQNDLLRQLTPEGQRQPFDLYETMQTPASKGDLAALTYKMDDQLRAVEGAGVRAASPDGPTPAPGTMPQLLAKQPDAMVFNKASDARKAAYDLRRSEGLSPDEVRIIAQGKQFQVEAVPMRAATIEQEMVQAKLLSDYKAAIQQPDANVNQLYNKLLKEKATAPIRPIDAPPAEMPVAKPLDVPMAKEPPLLTQEQPVVQNDMSQPQEAMQNAQGVIDIPEQQIKATPEAASPKSVMLTSASELRSSYPNEVSRIPEADQPKIDALDGYIQSGTPIEYGYQSGIGRTSQFDTAIMKPTHFEVSRGSVKIAGYNNLGQPVSQFISEFNPPNLTPTGRAIKVGSKNYRNPAGITTDIKPYAGEFSSEPPVGYVRPSKVAEAEKGRLIQQVKTYADEAKQFPELKKQLKAINNVLSQENLSVSEFNRQKSNLEAILMTARDEGKLKQIDEALNAKMGKC